MEGILFLSLFVLVPAALLAFVRPAGRRAFFALGLIATFASAVLLGLSRPDDMAAFFLQAIPLGVVLGALLVELGALVLALARGRRGYDGGR